MECCRYCNESLPLVGPFCPFCGAPDPGTASPARSDLSEDQPDTPTEVQGRPPRTDSVDASEHAADTSNAAVGGSGRNSVSEAWGPTRSQNGLEPAKRWWLPLIFVAILLGGAALYILRPDPHCPNVYRDTPAQVRAHVHAGMMARAVEEALNALEVCTKGEVHGQLQRILLSAIDGLVSRVISSLN
jgi:hypothetical protein